jgi:hypothetical protein
MVLLFIIQCLRLRWMNLVYLFMLPFSMLVYFGLRVGHTSFKLSMLLSLDVLIILP